jgi:hypothetical protein
MSILNCDEHTFQTMDESKDYAKPDRDEAVQGAEMQQVADDGLLDSDLTEVQDLLRFNDLDYTIDPNASCCVGRQWKTYYSRSSTYVNSFAANGQETHPRQKIRVRIDSGSRFVNPTTSYVSFRIRFTPPYKDELAGPLEHLFWTFVGLQTQPNPLQAPTPGQLCMASLFRSVSWQHASKNNIDEIKTTPVDSLRYICSKSLDYRNSVGSICETHNPQGYEMEEVKAGDSPTMVEEDVLIPLSVLFPTWNPHTKGQLISNRMIGGSEMTFEMDDMFRFTKAWMELEDEKTQENSLALDTLSNILIAQNTLSV